MPTKKVVYIRDYDKRREPDAGQPRDPADADVIYFEPQPRRDVREIRAAAYRSLAERLRLGGDLRGASNSELMADCIMGGPVLVG